MSFKSMGGMGPVINRRSREEASRKGNAPGVAGIGIVSLGPERHIIAAVEKQLESFPG